MAIRDGLVINDNANRNANQNLNQNSNQAQDDIQDDNQGQNPPPHNPFLPNAPIAPETPQRPQLKIGPIFSLNMQVNWKKMQKGTYLGQPTGWTHTTFRIEKRYRDFVIFSRGS